MIWNKLRVAALTTLAMVPLVTAPPVRGDDQTDIEAIKQRYEYRQKILLAKDFAALERFYPDDHLVTNPYNQVTNKEQVMRLIREDTISYSSFERQFDHIRIYGDTAIVLGGETVVRSPDAKTPDAGKTIRRRFTEVWMRRDGVWQVVNRHASNIVSPSN